jgi:hypothetical protein
MRFFSRFGRGIAIPKLNVEGSNPFARFLASLEAVNPALRAGVTSLCSVTGPAGAPAGRYESLCPLWLKVALGLRIPCTPGARGRVENTHSLAISGRGAHPSVTDHCD